MDFNEFAVDFPDLYSTIVEDIERSLEMYQVNGEESLQDWDNLIDDFVKKYEYEDSREDNMAQQFPDSFRDRDGYRYRRRRRRRPYRDFELRDIIRLIYLRRLFDRNRFF